MSEAQTQNPTVGFVSLGCPKALVDSERILTQLQQDGYAISGSYEGADLVIVNTCGFIDSAKQESLDAIGEALAENGRVIVTGCMGAGDDAKRIQDLHPKVLSVTGPAAYEDVMTAVRHHVPKPQEHNPFIDLVPDHGIKLTPRHYAYLKISEGCNHFGFFLANTLATIFGQTGDWGILSSGILVSFIESTNRIIYTNKGKRNNTRSYDRKVDKILSFINNVKIGMLYGFFVEAFKLGS